MRRLLQLPILLVLLATVVLAVTPLYWGGLIPSRALLTAFPIAGGTLAFVGGCFFSPSWIRIGASFLYGLVLLAAGEWFAGAVHCEPCLPNTGCPPCLVWSVPIAWFLAAAGFSLSLVLGLMLLIGASRVGKELR